MLQYSLHLCCVVFTATSDRTKYGKVSYANASDEELSCIHTNDATATRNNDAVIRQRNDSAF